MFIETSKDTAFHYYVKDFWALNVAFKSSTLVINMEQLLWVTVLSLGLNLDDEFFATVEFEFRASSTAFYVNSIS